MHTLPQDGDLFQGRYELHEVLGEGGFARVHRATDHEVGREVAIKLLKPGEGPSHQTAADRFAKEMKLVARVRDRHVVTLYDYGRTADGMMFMVLELISGRDLREILKDGPIGEAAALHIMTQLLHALHAAHSAGMLHRDVKPGNVRVFEYMDDPWRVKLLDFGIAKTLVDDAALTATGMAVGTPRFMTPEQLYGEPVGPTTDLYSLAIVAYEMLTGEQLDHLRRLANGERVVVRPDPRISESVRVVLNRMLEREPSRRFPSANAVLAAMDGRQARSAPPVSDTTPTRERVSATRGVPTQTPPLTKRLGLLAVLAIVTGASAGLLILSLTGAADDPATKTTPSSTRQHTLTLLQDGPDEPTDAPETQKPRLEPGALVDVGAEDLSGCDLAPPHQGLGVFDTADGLRRVEWYVHIPKSYDPTVPHPVVMLFHDDASDPVGILDQTNLAATAEQEGFILVLPRDRTIAPVWQSEMMDDVRLAFDGTAERLCVDRERVFAVGHGAGGNAVARLTCQDWVKGFALASYIIADPTFACAPERPASVVFFAPMNTGFQPPEGGQGCAGMTKLSYDEYEGMWRKRNATTDEPEILHQTAHGTCRQWNGAATFMSCRVKGGRPWPGAPARRTDLLNCDGEPPKFDFNGVLWQFFESLG